MYYQAVIFDLDGTLLDTLEDIADTANAVLVRYGFPSHDQDAYRYFIGDGIGTLFRRSLPAEEKTEERIKDCVKTFRENYKNNWNKKTKPYAGVPELLTALADRDIITAVLSNKPDVFTKQCVYELLPDWEFKMVVGEREGIPRKPNPASAIDMAEGLGVKPSRVIYVGDSGVDMETAVRSGFFPVGVLWGFRSRKELEDSGAKVMIEKPLDLLGCLEVPDQ